MSSGAFSLPPARNSRNGVDDKQGEGRQIGRGPHSGDQPLDVSRIGMAQIDGRGNRGEGDINATVWVRQFESRYPVDDAATRFSGDVDDGAGLDAVPEPIGTGGDVKTRYLAQERSCRSSPLP